MYSPCPESLDVPLTYRMGWINCVASLLEQLKSTSKPIPADVLGHWLGVAAESVIEIAKNPQDLELSSFCFGRLAYELAQRSGQSYENCASLITHRMILRHEDEARRAA